jgi:hypothetical protein
MTTESAAGLILAEGAESKMVELTMTDPEPEEIERLADRAWLLALGTFHRKVCVGKLDLKGELEILGEELARVRAAGEPLEELDAFLDKHGIRVPVKAMQPEVDPTCKQILDYLAETNEPRTRVEIEDHVEGRTAHKRTALKNLCTTGKVVKAGTGVKGNPLHYGLAIKGGGNNNLK